MFIMEAIAQAKYFMCNNFIYFQLEKKKQEKKNENVKIVRHSILLRYVM